MKRILRFFPITSLCAIVVSCASNGNPYEDSIFFSPHMADKRLDEKRGELARIEQQTEAERIAAITNKRRIGATNSENASKRAEIAKIRSLLTNRQAELSALDKEIEAARLDNIETERLVAKRTDLEKEISHLNRRLTLLIETY